MPPDQIRAQRLSLLRRRMKKLGIDLFLVPSADAFQGEYVPGCDRRLEWISGFTGSMGIGVIAGRKAYLLVDGRYTLQAGLETDPRLFEVVESAGQGLVGWLEKAIRPGQALGVDPWLVSAETAQRLEAALARAGGGWRQLERNPIDALWTDRPAEPASPAKILPLSFAGEASTSKRARLVKSLTADRADCWLVAQPESVCWLLNLRGNDVPNTPLLRARAILHADKSLDLFLAPRRLEGKLDPGARLHDPERLPDVLERLGRQRKSVLIDPGATPRLLCDLLDFSGAKLIKGQDPSLLHRAIKNPIEIKGAKSAHRRDGRALVRFLSGLKAGIGECEAARLVDGQRARERNAQGPSFDTIAAYGPNGAIVHYRAKPGRDARLKAGGLFLLDSGGQYLDGTTDVTRTVFIGPGKPGDEEKRLFTLVLKGHIALASSIFPEGTNGGQLDALARQFLWQAGLDYDHGTGHGVGSYLSVHEGPARIAKSGGGAALSPGMVLSIEPGYYRTGKFGIRIESLGLVVKRPKPKGAERSMLGFEILTLIPIDRKLIAPGLLTKPERDWLNAYHQRVGKALRTGLDARALAWLERATAPI